MRLVRNILPTKNILYVLSSMSINLNTIQSKELPLFNQTLKINFILIAGAFKQ